MLDLYRLNFARSEDTHFSVIKLLPQKKITSVKNLAALKEVRSTVESIQAHHAAHHVKNGLLCMINAYFVEKQTKQ